MADINFLMKQAKKMQQMLQKKLEELRVEASSGGGAVKVVLNGHKEVVSLKIEDDSLLEDKQMVEDLIIAALSEGYKKVDEEIESSMKGFGGLGFPGLF